jgi:DNA-binding winged helix-turn-helix (wHTH) protein
MLLDRPGELVTREELRLELWPVNTFVDFDHGLNSAVARLRESLNDSAEGPRFVETVPRRGYRFIGQLEESRQESTADSSTPFVRLPVSFNSSQVLAAHRERNNRGYTRRILDARVFQ